MQIIKVLIFLHAILAMCEHRSSLEAKDNPAFWEMILIKGRLIHFYVECVWPVCEIGA